jgi:hypothetical protein
MPSQLSEPDLKAMLTQVPRDELGALYSIDHYSLDYPDTKYEKVKAKDFERGVPRSEWETVVLNKQSMASDIEQRKSGVRLNFTGNMQYVFSKKDDGWKLEDTVKFFPGIDRKKGNDPECENSPNQLLKKDANKKSRAF